MALTQSQLAQAVASSKLGKYELVKLALEWIAANKYNEEYRKLTQTDIITKALNDIMEGIATPEKISELNKKISAREKSDKENCAPEEAQAAPKAE